MPVQLHLRLGPHSPRQLRGYSLIMSQGVPRNVLDLKKLAGNELRQLLPNVWLVPQLHLSIFTRWIPKF